MLQTEVVFAHLVEFLGPMECCRVLRGVSRTVKAMVDSTLADIDPRRPSVSMDEVKRMAKSSSSVEVVLNGLLTQLRGDCTSFLSKRATNGDTPLTFFARTGNVRAVRLILQFAPNVDLAGSGDMTPLHCAAFSGNQTVAELLLERGANPGLTDAIGRLPEDWAHMQGDAQLGTLLRRARKARERRKVAVARTVGCFAWIG